MPTGGRLFATATAVVGCLAITSFSPATSVGSLLYAAPALPDKLGDREFWLLTEELSESTGTFPAENFLSNERGYQLVMPDLIDHPLDQVRPYLESHGLIVSTVKFEAYPGIRDGIIIRQFPLRGAPVSSRDPITIVVTRQEQNTIIEQPPATATQ